MTIPMRSMTPAQLLEILTSGILKTLADEKKRVDADKAKAETKLNEAQAKVNSAWDACLNCETGEYDALSTERAKLEGARQYHESWYHYRDGQQSEIDLVTKYITSEINSFKKVYTAELTRELDPWEVPA